jgi:hypothetical protein
VRTTAIGVFAAGFLFLLGSVVAVILGQLQASALGAWLSLAYSLGAVLCTAVAVRMRGDRW